MRYLYHCSANANLFWFSTNANRKHTELWDFISKMICLLWKATAAMAFLLHAIVVQCAYSAQCAIRLMTLDHFHMAKFPLTTLHCLRRGFWVVWLFNMKNYFHLSKHWFNTNRCNRIDQSNYYLLDVRANRANNNNKSCTSMQEKLLNYDSIFFSFQKIYGKIST